MSINNNNDTEVWTVGQGGNGRAMPLELKRRFAWVFASASLPSCIDSGALVEIEPGSEDVYLKWRDILFKLNSQSDIEILAGKMPYANYTLPQNLPLNCDLGFITFDTKNDLGFSALYAASREEFKKIITFCDDSANFKLNKDHSKIEVLPPEFSGDMEELCSKFGDLPVFVEFSLTGVGDPIELTGKIRESQFIKGISVRNDLPVREQELPEKIIGIVQDAGFKGSVLNRIFVGYRDD
jgi:hypothetical protein